MSGLCVLYMKFIGNVMLNDYFTNLIFVNCLAKEILGNYVGVSDFIFFFYIQWPTASE